MWHDLHERSNRHGCTEEGNEYFFCTYLALVQQSATEPEGLDIHAHRCHAGNAYLCSEPEYQAIVESCSPTQCRSVSFKLNMLTTQTFYCLNGCERIGHMFCGFAHFRLLACDVRLET
jgi:hypothetical protein